MGGDSATEVSTPIAVTIVMDVTAHFRILTWRCNGVKWTFCQHSGGITAWYETTPLGLEHGTKIFVGPDSFVLMHGSDFYRLPHDVQVAVDAWVYQFMEDVQ